MQKRTLGKSGLEVTPLGLGLAALGRPGYINLGHAQDLGREYEVAAMEEQAHEVLDAAWAAGVRYFDAARSYGKAEQFLSSWLARRNIGTEAVTVGSKWGYTYTADWQVEAETHEVKEHSLPVLERQIHESITLLNRHLDLYQIHSATLDSGVLDNQAVLGRLAEMRNNGLRIGLTVSGTGQADTLRKALTVRFDGELLFASAQVTWNLLAQEAEPALLEAADAGVGIIVKEALANGRLTPKNEAPAFAEKHAVLEQAAARYDTSIDAIALAAVLAQPWASVVLSGAATVEQLQSNAAAAALTLDGDTLTALRGLVEPADVYWEKRSNLEWN